MGSDWNWNEKESTVISSVQAVAVYTNPHGDIVIRQQDHYGGDDAVIVVPRSQAATLAKAIREEAKKPFVPEDADAA